MDHRTVDLHVHSNKSDGTFTPKELVSAAEEAGLSAFALTDHDTVSGIDEATAAASRAKLELIPGIELSTHYQIPPENPASQNRRKPSEKEIHVVGLFIDPKHPLLLQKLQEFRRCRDERNAAMVEALQKEGFPITMEALMAENPDCVVTRANIARFLCDHGMIKTRQEAFDKYIGDGCRCYVGRFMISPMDAVTLIHQAGGIAVLAHPLLYHLGSAALQRLIDDLKAVGLDGIEAVYSTYTAGEERLVRNLANENGLLVSGGSDFHGANKPHIRLGTGMGTLNVPYSVLEALKERRAKNV